MHLLDSELAPESVFPAQFSELSIAGARLQPEKRLQAAVLSDAVLTFHRLAGRDRARARRLFAEVEAWFASDDASTPFTFVAICDSLKFDPSYIRRGLTGAPTKKRFLRRDGNGTRHQVVMSRLRRVA